MIVDPNLVFEYKKKSRRGKLDATFRLYSFYVVVAIFVVVVVAVVVFVVVVVAVGVVVDVVIVFVVMVVVFFVDVVVVVSRKKKKVERTHLNEEITSPSVFNVLEKIVNFH